MNALLIAAEKWVLFPDRLVIVGVSPKSFGHYFYGQQSRAGLNYLGIETELPGLLPGNELLNGMYLWLIRLLADYPAALRNVDIDRSAYVVRQVRYWLIQYRRRVISAEELRRRLGLMTTTDWWSLLRSALDAEVWRRLAQAIRRRSASQSQPLLPGLEQIDGVANIREFEAWLGIAT